MDEGAKAAVRAVVWAGMEALKKFKGVCHNSGQVVNVKRASAVPKAPREPNKSAPDREAEAAAARG